MEELKSAFSNFIDEHKKTTPLSNLNPGEEFRIATYNVHYFTNLNETQSTYDGVLQDIRNIDADVIGLQEFILGNKVKINKKNNVVVDLTNFYDTVDSFGYTKSVLCNSVPSWFKSIYGNIVLVKSTICNDTLCEKLLENIHTFDKSTKTAEVSGTHKGINETRCYIKIKTSYNGNNIYIYTTHLDVASENLRTKQMDYIIEDSKQHNDPNDVVFIMGDFNTFDIDDLHQETSRYKNDSWKLIEHLKDNGEVVELLKKNGFVDCHQNSKSIMTTWNNTRVDFIFCNKQITGDFRAEYLYTSNSDHLPVIVTLTKATGFLDNPTPTTPTLPTTPLTPTKGVNKKRKSRKSRHSLRPKRSLKRTPLNRRYKTNGSS